ncbi:hypothetical protein ACFX12_047395 [Malus domestica]
MEAFPLCMMIALLSVAAYFFITRLVHGGKYENWKNSPPGPVGWPILGNLLQLSSSQIHEHLFKLSKIHGPLFSLKLGPKPVIVAASPEMARIILKEQEAVFSNHVANETSLVMSYDATSLVYSPMGTRWRVLRRILNENVFSTRALDNFTPLRKQKVHGLLKQLYSASSSKNPVNIGEWVFITVANITSNLTCSKSLFEYTTKEGREMKESLRELIKLLGTGNVADFFPLFKPFDPQGLKRRTLEIFWKYDASYEKLIDERLKEREIGINNNSKKEKGDMLDALLNYRSDKDDDLRTLSRNMIKSLLSDMFIASTETSTSTVEWGMAEILKNPDVHKKLVLELDQVVGKDRFVEESDIANLPYLQAAVKEVFRLHPAVPLITRRSYEACEVSGYHFPKDCVAMVNIWGMARDPSIWEEPCKFKPERFIGSKIDVKGQDFNLLPFGCGKRICVGWPLAHRTVQFYLAAFLHAFEWECPPEVVDNMEEFVGITIQKAKSIIAIPKPRLSTSVYM